MKVKQRMVELGAVLDGGSGVFEGESGRAGLPVFMEAVVLKGLSGKKE